MGKVGGLSLYDFASFDRFGRYPHLLYLTGGQENADVLKVRAEGALHSFGDVCTNAAALLALTFAVDPAAGDGALAGDCTNSCHGVVAVWVERKAVEATALTSLCKYFVGLFRPAVFPVF